MISNEREAKINEVVARRQGNLTVVLENVHDPHNIGAVLRTCDSVGIKEVFILLTDENIGMERLRLGKRSSSGARKWVDVKVFRDTDKCFNYIREHYDFILGTHLNEKAVDLYETDLTGSVALVFGNEHDGISQKALPFLDGNFLIPQVGMVQSLNISVACAITLYEAYRQRLGKDLYNTNTTMNPEEQEALKKEYFRRHLYKVKGRSPKWML